MGDRGRVGATQETHAAVHAGRRQRQRGRAHFTCGSLSWPVVHIAKAKGREQGPALEACRRSVALGHSDHQALDESSYTTHSARHARRQSRLNSHAHKHSRPPIDTVYSSTSEEPFDAYQRYNCDKPHLSLCICCNSLDDLISPVLDTSIDIPCIHSYREHLSPSFQHVNIPSHLFLACYPIARR
jgi:hypothetical protein